MNARLLDRDALNNADVGDVANCAMAIINATQDMRPQNQVTGLAAAFLLVCERFGVSAQDAFAVISNIMNHADGRRPEFAAVKQFMEEEL